MSLDRLISSIAQKQNPTVAGLDPKWEYIPSYIRQKAVDAYGETLEAAKDYCKIIKQEKSSAKLREPLEDDEAKRLFEEIQKNKLGK